MRLLRSVSVRDELQRNGPLGQAAARKARPSVSYLEVVRVVGVRHQVAVVGALQLEAVRDASVRVAVLAVAAEVGQTFVVAQLLEVLVVVGHPSVAQVFHHAWITKWEDLMVRGMF